MTHSNRIATVAACAGILGSRGNKFQERQLLALASDMVLELPRCDQAAHMNLLKNAHKAGLVPSSSDVLAPRTA
jgi:hypothetical protein